MEASVFKKVRQLNSTVQSLLDDPSKLIPSGAAVRPIQPVVVTGEGFPVSPITCRYIEEYCASNQLLVQDGVRRLCVIDMGDLECLEGLAGHGYSMLTVLDGWKQSDLAEISLRNYLLETFPWDPNLYRPQRMRPRVQAAYDGIVAHLKIRTSPGVASNG